MTKPNLPSFLFFFWRVTLVGWAASGFGTSIFRLTTSSTWLPLSLSRAIASEWSTDSKLTPFTLNTRSFILQQQTHESNNVISCREIMEKESICLHSINITILCTGSLDLLPGGAQECIKVGHHHHWVFWNSVPWRAACKQCISNH